MRNLAFFVAVISSLVSACAAGQDGLNAIQEGIVSDHKSVAQLSAEAFLSLDPSETLVLDIREPKEYAVSRIPGAIRVSPGADAQSALTQIGNVTDKNVVVYCSVGKRSSIFAERVQDDLKAKGAASVSNLEQGIFGWHNDKRVLVDANGKTDAVHPYNQVWKRYLTRDEKAQFEPIAVE